MSLFAPATRHQLRARIALDGPTGSGKTWSMLAWARALAGPEGRIAVVDTERGSASLYSDRFSFDVLTWAPPYDPRKLAEVLRAAETEGYDVICVDSLTHFWKGEGGTLDIVEAAGSRSGGNKYAGWQTGTPALRTLIDTMLGLDAHFVATMRSKMEHVLMENSRGKLEPVKIGMQPEMRADIEYEFTLCVSMDLDHRGTVTKSRCEELADALIAPGLPNTEDAASRFLAWLRDGAPSPEPLSAVTRDALRRYLNERCTGEQRSQIRSLWPVGVPELADPALQERHLERILRVIEHVTGHTDVLPAGDGLPADPEFDVDPDDPSGAPDLEPEPATEPPPAGGPADSAQEPPEPDPGPDGADEAPAAPETANPADSGDDDPIPDDARAEIIAGVQGMTPGGIKAALANADERTVVERGAILPTGEAEAEAAAE